MEKTQQTDSESYNGKEILNFVRIDNDIKVKKFFDSDLGQAYNRKLEVLKMQHSDKREIVLTSKNKVMALLLDSSDLNIKKLQTATQEQTEKSKEEMQRLQATA